MIDDLELRKLSVARVFARLKTKLAPRTRVCGPKNLKRLVVRGAKLHGLSSNQQRTVSFQMLSDPQAFIAEHKDKDIDALVEQVRDGTQLRVRLLLDDGNHQFVNLVRSILSHQTARTQSRLLPVPNRPVLPAVEREKHPMPSRSARRYVS